MREPIDTRLARRLVGRETLSRGDYMRRGDV